MKREKKEKRREKREKKEKSEKTGIEVKAQCHAELDLTCARQHKKGSTKTV